jgi:GT2 family glycosyltransferase
MLFHRSLLDKIGGLDERFYPGNYEDDDFSMRTRISEKNLWVAMKGMALLKKIGLTTRFLH